ncbi:gliding motility-associated C-terminal domain-containing protein, partial [Bacteroidales bacterium OttesenSCG-928-C19]|nr:gliding motility-associated C-terminal domain-containing protein [Bacteroidales bacterium OttesenSCG-928-C19]
TISIDEVVTDNTGSISLLWDDSGITNPQKVEIFRKKGNAAVFESIYSTSSFPSNSYTDATANGNYQANTYVVEITTTTGVFSDTIQSIYLEVEESTEYNRALLLSWNSPYAGFSGNFFVYRKIQSGSLELIGISDSFTFSDTIIGTCKASIFYYVEYKNTKNQYTSNTVQENFADKYAAPPVWNSVSTDLSSQKIRLSWIPSTDKDIAGYIICEGTPCVSPDTVWGKEQSSFICSYCDPLEVYHFKIFSFDSCATPNASTLSNSLNNIVLSTSSKVCSKEIQLSWNAYENSLETLGGYNIYAQEDGNAFKVIEKLSADKTSYLYEAPDNVSSVRLYVEAFNNSSASKSTSNVVSVLLDDDAKKYVNIESASVLDDNSAIELTIYFDSSFANSNQELYRGINSSNPVFYKKLPAEKNFTDDDVNPYKNMYSYYIKTTIGCTSNTSTAIKTSLSKTANAAYLEWTPYIGWDDVLFYSIERKIGSSGWTSIGTVAGSELRFTDDVSLYANSEERIFYRVIANNRNNITASSSVVEYIKEGYIIMPNAFLPNTVSNAIFKPKTFSVLNEGYSFRIFSRTGECVFQTNNPNEGWDGKFKGKMCPLGGYVYLIQCIYTNGKTESISGSFLLVE